MHAVPLRFPDPNEEAINRYCSEAVGALLRAAARPDPPDEPLEPPAAAQFMSWMWLSPHLRPRTPQGHGGDQGQAPREE